MEKVRWGFIGAGGIARKALYPAIMKSEVGEIYAVAARDATRAASLSPSGKTYTDYQDLLDDPMVEAIYISLPNSLHLPWAVKAMRAGKHVLCEKPLGMNAAEVKDAIEVSNESGKLFMEASWNRWHPRTIRIKELVAAGVIGKVRSVDTSFTYTGLDSANIRLVPELGGGILYDLGPYSVVAPLWLLDFAPISDLKAEVVWHSGGTDETVKVAYNIGGAKAETHASANKPSAHWFIVRGDNGHIATGGNDSFNSHNQPSTLEIEIDGVKEIEEFPACDPYMLMSDSFAKKIRGQEAWLMPLSESLAFAEFFDSVFKAMGRP